MIMLQARAALLDRFLDVQDKVRCAAISSICRAGVACLEVSICTAFVILVLWHSSTYQAWDRHLSIRPHRGSVRHAC